MDGNVNVQDGDLVGPTPELPDNTPIDRVQFPARIHKALAAGGFNTVGEIRETSDEMLLNLQGLESSSIFYLREALGLPSCDGVRPLEKNRATVTGQQMAFTILRTSSERGSTSLVKPWSCLMERRGQSTGSSWTSFTACASRSLDTKADGRSLP